MSSEINVALGFVLSVHVAVLLLAVHGGQYFGFKKSAFVTGLGAVALVLASFSNRGTYRITPLLAMVAFAVANLTSLTALISSNFSVSKGLGLYKRTYILLFRRAVPLNSFVFVLLGAIYEEVIWRGGIQRILGDGPLAITMTSYVFTMAHVSLSKKMRWPRMIDVASFSLIVGACFAATHNIAFPILVHFTKNIMLLTLRHAADPQYRDTEREIATRFRMILARFGSLVKTPSVRVANPGPEKRTAS